MSCNCNNTITCQQCSAGLPCNCPPDYSVMPQPVDCGCDPSGYGCPPGYHFNATASPGFPNGFCCPSTNPIGCTLNQAVAPVPCVDCIESMPASCVFVSNIPCLGVTQGNVPLSTVLSYLCSTAYIESILTKIGLDPNLSSGLCQLVTNCPPSGSTVPIPLPIIITFP